MIENTTNFEEKLEKETGDWRTILLLFGFSNGIKVLSVVGKKKIP